MVKNILQYLENNANKYPEKIIFATEKEEMTYGEFMIKSKQIGSSIGEKLNQNQTMNSLNIKKPIVIFMEKRIECLVAMIGTVYSGNFYTVIDTKSPEGRIKSILDTLEPEIIIADDQNCPKIEKISSREKIYKYDNCLKEHINSNLLEKIRNNMIDTDLLYVLFTSGSTGEPKGIAVCHKSVITYINWVIETFNINSKTIFGNQTPFYFSMSVLDIYATIFSGATLYIIPKKYFSFPIKLLEFMNSKKINTIYWVPSALCIVANLKTLEYIQPKYIEKILFAGEVMPVKQLNEWRKHVNATYVNLYGPTEVTDICTYYILDREFKDNESIPIGKACDNCNVLVLKNDNTLAKIGEKGELCVRGSFLAMGYYKDKEKNEELFVQNPLNKEYPEIIYKTGDIVKYNEKGELMYISRKDSQIKHMGYRIELGEIEKNVNSIKGIIIGICIYDESSSKIILFYQSQQIEKNKLKEYLKEKLLPYMIPNEVIEISSLPYNANGKIDRKKLKKNFMEGKYKWID